MSFIGSLMDIAAADTDVLRSLNENGDNFAIPREVDFLIRAPSLEKAETIAGFINDYNYAVASALEQNGDFQVQVFITMPVNQHIILSVSGFIACIAHIFGAEYDGWGCVAQRPD